MNDGRARSTEEKLKTFNRDFDFAPFIDFQGETSWSVRKALLFKNINVFYSLIPKNACTSILTTLAAANGLTSKWFQTRNRIHNMQLKYLAFENLDEFHDDTFKIVALREPIRRAISAINNKLVDTSPENPPHQRFFEAHLRKKIDQCRLSEIFRLIDIMPHFLIDEHFAPQWSFLFYDRYDLVIDADHLIPSFSIGNRELKVGQHNKMSKPHSTEEIGDATIADIRQLIRETGSLPAVSGYRAIFAQTIRREGNFDRANRLWEALQQAG